MAKKKEISWAKAILVGLVGSLLFKAIEYLVVWEHSYISDGAFYYGMTIASQIIFLVSVTALAVTVFKLFKFKKHSYIFIPVIYRIFAGFYNLIFVTDFNFKMLLADSMEAVILGLMVGFVAYKLFEKVKI